MAERNHLLVTGASGYLGRQLCARAEESGWRVTGTFNSAKKPPPDIECIPLRLEENETVIEEILRSVSPDAIIHAAALNPAGDPDQMARVNGVGSGRVAAAAARIGARLVYVSSDVVHDGTDAPYGIDASPTARDPYGRSKALGEAAVARADPDACIVRTSLIYSLDAMDRGTASFAQRLARGEVVELFRDVIRQPIHIDSLVAALLRLAGERSDLSGVLNVAGSQAVNREHHARGLMDWWQVPGRERAESCCAARLPSPPPLDLQLDLEPAQRTLALEFPGFDTVLARAYSDPGARPPRRSG